LDAWRLRRNVAGIVVGEICVADKDNVWFHDVKDVQRCQVNEVRSGEVV
jgi:hypothetical protein